MPYQQTEFDRYFHLWRLENHSPDWFLFDSVENTRILKQQAACYGGVISISHFIRAMSELVASGEIKQLRQRKPPSAPDFELTADEYYRLPAATVVRRYRTEPAFHAAVDQLITDQKI